MEKKWWIVLFVVLISSNLLVYIIYTDKNLSENFKINNFDNFDVQNLLKSYYILFGMAIIATIIIILLRIIRSSFQDSYF